MLWCFFYTHIEERVEEYRFKTVHHSSNLFHRLKDTSTKDCKDGEALSSNAKAHHFLLSFGVTSVKMAKAVAERKDGHCQADRDSRIRKQFLPNRRHICASDRGQEFRRWCKKQKFFILFIFLNFRLHWLFVFFSHFLLKSGNISKNVRQFSTLLLRITRRNIMLSCLQKKKKKFKNTLEKVMLNSSVWSEYVYFKIENCSHKAKPVSVSSSLNQNYIAYHWVISNHYLWFQLINIYVIYLLKILIKLK